MNCYNLQLINHNKIYKKSVFQVGNVHDKIKFKLNVNLNRQTQIKAAHNALQRVCGCVYSVYKHKLTLAQVGGQPRRTQINLPTLAAVSTFQLLTFRTVLARTSSKHSGSSSTAITIKIKPKPK